MLDPAEAVRVRETFGVDDLQVRRDHLVSYLLAALSTHAADRVIFFGGTALSRTHLVDVRLSEDVDLIAVGRRREVAADVERPLAAAARRQYGQLRWSPPLSAVRDVEPATLVTADGLAVRLQLLSGAGLAAAARQPDPARRHGVRGSRSGPRRLARGAVDGLATESSLTPGG